MVTQRLMYTAGGDNLGLVGVVGSYRRGLERLPKTTGCFSSRRWSLVRRCKADKPTISSRVEDRGGPYLWLCHCLVHLQLIFMRCVLTHHCQLSPCSIAGDSALTPTAPNPTPAHVAATSSPISSPEPPSTPETQQPTSSNSGHVWVPKVGDSWQYNLDTPVDTDVNADVFFIDMGASTHQLFTLNKSNLDLDMECCGGCVTHPTKENTHDRAVGRDCAGAPTDLKL